jgi:hypothetical protein
MVEMNSLTYYTRHRQAIVVVAAIFTADACRWEPADMRQSPQTGDFCLVQLR